jgi:hypothetical protein
MGFYCIGKEEDTFEEIYIEFDKMYIDISCHRYSSLDTALCNELTKDKGKDKGTVLLS